MSSGLIYDIGAHKGEDTSFYLKKGFNVVAVEAIPDFCSQLERKFDNFVRAGQLQILNIAISKTVGTVDFYVDENNSAWGTMNLDWVERNRSLGTRNTRKIVVESRTLIDVIREYGVPRYCKIDIEGGDLDALKSLIGSNDIPPYISIESEKRDWNRLREEFSTFRELGYRRYKVIDQTLVSLQTCPKPAREGHDCEYVFEEGSSGLFADELPGSWLDLTEAIEAYRQVFLGYALNGDNGMFSRKFSIFRAIGLLQAKVAHAKVTHKSYVNPALILPPAAWYDTHAAL
jgi:FkbM family methyltransferase